MCYNKDTKERKGSLKMTTKRNNLLQALVDIIEESENEVLDFEFEDEYEWGFVECTNPKGQLVRIVLTDSPEIFEMYIDDEKVVIKND